MPLQPRIATLLKNALPDEQIEVRGWVRTRRDSKNGFSFIELNDGSCMSNLQIVVDADVPGYADTIKSVTTGASIAIAGTVKESPGKGQRIEVHAAELTLLGEADPNSFPLQKRDTVSNSCAKSLTCARGQTALVRSLVSATPFPVRYTTSFSHAGFCTSIHPSSRPATAKAPGKCFRSRHSIWPDLPRCRQKSTGNRTSSASPLH